MQFYVLRCSFSSFLHHIWCLGSAVCAPSEFLRSFCPFLSIFLGSRARRHLLWSLAFLPFLQTMQRCPEPTDPAIFLLCNLIVYASPSSINCIFLFFPKNAWTPRSDLASESKSPRIWFFRFLWSCHLAVFAAPLTTPLYSASWVALKTFPVSWSLGSRSQYLALLHLETADPMVWMKMMN